MTAGIRPQIVALAAYGLPGAPPIEPEGWDARLDSVADHGVTGLLDAAHRAGRLDLGEAAVERVAARLEAEAVQAVRLESELIRLADVLERWPAVLIKGAVLAHSVYPDPQWRPFTDLDVLVPATVLHDVIAELERLGYQRPRPDPSPSFARHVAKATALVHPSGLVVDLHRTLVSGAAGDAIDVEQIVASRWTMEVGALRVPAPTWETHLVAAAVHASIGDGLGRALSVRDVAQIANIGGLDHAAAIDLARQWSVEAPFGAALRAVTDGLGVYLPHALAAVAARHHGSAEVVDPSARAARLRLDELRHGSLRRRMSLARSLVLPDPSFLRWTYGDRPLPSLYAQRWRHLVDRAQEAVAEPEARSVESAPTEPLSQPELEPATPEAPDQARDRRPAHLDVEPTAPATIGPELHLANMGTVDRSQPGRRWWQYRHAELPVDEADVSMPREPDSTSAAAGVTESVAASQTALGLKADEIEIVQTVNRSGTPLFFLGAALLAINIVASQLGTDGLGIVLVPAAGLLFAGALARRNARLRPAEAWVGKWLLLGVVVKLVASYLRYLTLVDEFEGFGDATGYDTYGRNLASAWLGDGAAPGLNNLRQTNFIRWFTGVVYYLFGSSMVVGFFVFGLLAFVGSYLWYRAAVYAVPILNKRMFLLAMLFAPSILYWPSSIGKESLMQLGIGAMALATALLMGQRLLVGLTLGAAAGWLIWIVRPHLLALVAVAAGFAYIVGRVREGSTGLGGLIARPAGMIVVGLLMVLTVTQGAEFLGIEKLSVSSIEEELDEQTERSAFGGSEFDSGENSLNPINLPRGAVTVLLRPFPWETDTPLQLLASLESVILAFVIIVRISSLRVALKRARKMPFLLYCWVLTALYAATFASFANFGLLVRQRSLVLPALFVLLCVEPKLDRRRTAELAAPVVREVPRPPPPADVRVPADARA